MFGDRPQFVSVLRRGGQAAPETVADYRRRARRLRHELRGDPVRLHQSLRAMVGPAMEPVARVTVSPAAAFGELVEKALDGPVLRYTQRIRLLKTAGRLGIGRFEANLLIAAALHRFRHLPPTMPVGRKYRFPALILSMALLESALVLAAWWLVRP
jgi:hypothetical protein